MSVFNILHTYRTTTYNANSAKNTYRLVHKYLINFITSDEVKPAGETVNVRSLIKINFRSKLTLRLKSISTVNFTDRVINAELTSLMSMEGMPYRLQQWNAFLPKGDIIRQKNTMTSNIANNETVTWKTLINELCSTTK